MTPPLVLVAVAVVIVWPIRLLAGRAKGSGLTPRVAILIWQAIGLGFTIAVIGSCADLISLASHVEPHRRAVTDFTRPRVSPSLAHALTPNQLFVMTASLVISLLIVGAVVTHSVGILRTRSCHRKLIDLLAEHRPEIPDAFVIEHPDAAAYSLAGLHPRVVISSGAIDLLNQDELEAVLAHERAHVRARHDLVLLPYRVLASMLPRSRVAASIDARLRSLVEFAADDRAMRECGPNALAGALCKLSIDERASSLASPAQSACAYDRLRRGPLVATRTRLRAVELGISAAGIVALPLVTIFATGGVR